MISDKCLEEAKGFFNGWLHTDSARRYSSVWDKEKAIISAQRAAFIWIDVLPEDEAQALTKDLRTAVESLERNDFKFATELLDKLSEQTFISSLQQVVACEIGKQSPESLGYHGGGRKNGIQ